MSASWKELILVDGLFPYVQFPGTTEMDICRIYEGSASFTFAKSCEHLWRLAYLYEIQETMY